MADPSTLITFTLADEVFALPVEWVDGVAPMEDLAPLPGTDAAVLGLAPVRGTVVAVIDPRVALQIDPRPYGGLASESLLVVATSSGRFGLLVDDVEIIPAEQALVIDAAPDGHPDPVVGTVVVGEHTRPVIDPERLVRDLVVGA